MAIEITARIVVSKKELQAQGIDTGTDHDIAVPVAQYLSAHLPHGWTADVTVGIRRKVKATPAADQA